MRPAFVIPLVLVAVTAACTAGCASTAEQTTTAVATWTYTPSGGASVGGLTTDPATGTLIELQGTPIDPALPQTSAVLALDPATGRQIWSTLTGNEGPTAAMPYKDLLAIAVSTNSSSSVWVLDARSGSEERSIDLPGDDQVTGLTGGSIITADTSNGVVSAFSPVSGRQIWNRNSFGRCQVARAAAGGAVVGVLANCPGNEIMLVGVDPATGRELWSRPVNHNFGQTFFGQPVSSGEPVTLTANGQLFSVSSAGTISLYTDAGQLVVTEPAQLYSPPWFTMAGSQALLVYQTAAGDLTVKSIDVATRATRTLLSEPYVMGSAAFSDGVAYINATAPEPLLPALLIALNVATGSFGVFALPFAGPESYYSLATTSDQVMVISIFPPSLIAAYRFPPPGAGSAHRIQGGAPGKWPAACSLVQASAIARLANGPYLPVARPLPTGARWPDATTCEFVPSRSGLPLVTVSVAWRAPGTAQAALLLRRSTVAWTRLGGMRDPAYQTATTGEVLMLVGRSIIEIKVSGTPQARKALADSVARQIEAGQ